MDKVRLQHQFLPPRIRPLRDDMIVIGRAMPVLSDNVFEEKFTGTANILMEEPFGLMLEALDDLHPNEIYVNTDSAPPQRSVGRTYDHPRTQAGQWLRRAGRVRPRYQNNPEDRLWFLRARLCSALQGG